MLESMTGSLKNSTPSLQTCQETVLNDMLIDVACDDTLSVLQDTLQTYNVRRVLDVATGSGVYSTTLLDVGYEVVSVDAQIDSLNLAFAGALQKGHRLNPVQADWRFLRRSVGDGYDAVICLGNAFSALFKLPERRRSLAEFLGVLNYEGILCLSHRNYDDLLISTTTHTGHTFEYEPANMQVEPVFVDNGLVRLAYTHEDADEPVYVNTYPILKKEMRHLLFDVGFDSVESFPIQKTQTNTQSPDFWFHVALKE